MEDINFLPEACDFSQLLMLLKHGTESVVHSQPMTLQLGKVSWGSYIVVCIELPIHYYGKILEC